MSDTKATPLPRGWTTTTPLPWRYTMDTEFRIIGPTGYDVLMFGDTRRACPSVADAALIVRAVNAHDRLLAEREELVKAMDVDLVRYAADLARFVERVAEWNLGSRPGHVDYRNRESMVKEARALLSRMRKEEG